MNNLKSKLVHTAGALAVSLLLAACNPSGRQNGEESGAADSIETSGLQEAVTIIYEDTIPCADCPGIIMNIRFNTTDLSYERSLTYLEATADGKDTTFKESGQYTTEKGYKEDENAILYVLASADSGNEQVFLASGDSAITALDGNREIIRSGLNYTLRKKE